MKLRFRPLTAAYVWICGAMALLAQPATMPRDLPPAVSKAWQSEGFATGWISKKGGNRLWFYGGAKKPKDMIPAFQMENTNVGLDVFDRLPSPSEPFGLDLWTFQWSDDSLKHLAKLQKLDTLCINLSGNSMMGIRHICGLTKLRSLGITVENTKIDIFKEVSKIKSLRTLVIHMGSVGGGVESLAELPELQTLVISTQTAPKNLAKLKNLTCLWIDASLSDEGIREIGDLIGLEELYLVDAGITDAQLRHFAGLHKLRLLNLEDNELVGKGLKDITRLENLRQLNLGFNKISDAGLEQLTHCKALQNLNLQWNDISDVGLRNLERIKTLEKLNVYSTRVSDRGKAELQKKLPALQYYEPKKEKGA